MEKNQVDLHPYIPENMSEKSTQVEQIPAFSLSENFNLNVFFVLDMIVNHKDFQRPNRR